MQGIRKVNKKNIFILCMFIFVLFFLSNIYLFSFLNLQGLVFTRKRA